MTKTTVTDTTKLETAVPAELFIPLNKLKKSPRNVRKTPHGQDAIEALAASIEAKGMLQNLVVEPEVKNGEPTGFYLVTIGEGRRQAHLLRAKRKQIGKNAPIRCVLDTINDAAEISLDENVTRTAMHPADQFEAFHDLAERLGMGVDDIAARFGVSAHLVRQRLRLAAVSPKLIAAYREGELRLEQLMAFTITEDHARQEQVFERLSHNKAPYAIRRELMQASVPAHDRRARFIGAEAYQDAGGRIVRDLFEDDDGGFFEDAGLLDRLVLEKLEAVAEAVRAEHGWKWSHAQIDYPHAHGLRRCYPQQVALSDADEARLTEASARYDRMAAEHEGCDDLPDDVARELAALENEIAALMGKRDAYDPDDIARAGVFVVLGHDGEPRVERGFIRTEDEPPVADVEDTGQAAAASESEPDDEPLSQRLPDSLIRDLTAHRTLGLRLALGEQPDIALIALTHALVAQVFYDQDASCLDIRLRSEFLGGHAAGIEDGKSALALARRHEWWAKELPQESDGLWAYVLGLDSDSRLSLLAHCVATSVTAVRLPNGRTHVGQHADDLARAVTLDMTQHWQATEPSYFSRVTKAQIVEAVAEAVSADVARRIEGLKKTEMVKAAERLVEGTGWLPQPLRLPEPAAVAADSADPLEPDADLAIAAE